MKHSILVIAVVAAIAVVGCSKKTPVVVAPQNQDAPALSSSSVSSSTAKDDSLKQAALNADALEAERLEGRRKTLEDLMNKLMSEEIYFEFDKAVLTDIAKDLLSQAGDILSKEPKLSVEIEGHTDARGTEAYNMSLGGKRAQSVADYLINYGVSKERLITLSYGEEKPKVEGTSETAFAQNRRAVFNVKIKK